MVRLTFFILVALALHTLAYLRMAPQLAPKQPRTVRTTVVPVRLTSRAPKSPPKAAAAPKSTPKAAAAPKPKAKAPPLPKLTRRADQTGLDHGARKPKAAPQKPAPKKPAPKKTSTHAAAQKPAAKPLANSTTFKSRDEYFQRMARLADQAPRAGWAVPDLVTDDGLRFTEMLEILRFYGCKVVAYPLPRGGAPSFFLELDGKNLDKAVRREGKNMLDGYSSRARDLTDQPGFWKLLTRIASAHQLDPYHACIAAVVPERVDRYFLYMQDRAARGAGLPLDALRSTQGRFRRTNVGWTLEIYEVTPRQGAPVAVRLDRG